MTENELLDEAAAIVTASLAGESLPIKPRTFAECIIRVVRLVQDAESVQLRRELDLADDGERIV